MSNSLREEQGFYFMQRKSSKISAQKGLNVHLRVMRDGKNAHLFHLERKKALISCNE